MLGQEVLPADVLPATATLNRVTYSEEPYVQVEYKNGKSERVDINKLEDYVTKLTAESEERAETVKEATVYYDTEFCKNNVDIIDQRYSVYPAENRRSRFRYQCKLPFLTV